MYSKRIIHALSGLIQLKNCKIYTSLHLRRFLTIKIFLILSGVLSFSSTKAQKNVDTTIQENKETISLFISCLLPVPQKINFSSKTFSFDNNWTVENVDSTEISRAYKCLLEGLNEKRS